MELSLAELRVVAEEVGLELVSVLALDDAQTELRAGRERLTFWQERGFAGEMRYMEREARVLTDVCGLLPQAQSVVCFVVSYNDRQIADEPPPGYGKVARYAWGRDYHRVLKRALRAFVRSVQERYFGSREIQWRVFSDAVPLLERALAGRASLGFIGKNTMLIRPGVGSFTFLAEVVWDVRVFDDAPQSSLRVLSSDSDAHCGSCSRCIDDCPTDAFLEPGVLDARLCISYLTIEKKSSLSAWERKALGHWLFGCDVCQDTCPFNHQAVTETSISAFSAEQGSGPFLSLESLLSIRDRESFLSRFAGTPLMRAGREGLLRNATCVAANTRYLAAIPSLIECKNEDSSELVRAHAGFALEELSEFSTGIERIRLKQALLP